VAAALSTMKVGRKTFIVAGIAALLVGVVIFVVWLLNPVRVHVANRTSEPLTEVTVATRDEVRGRNFMAPFDEWSLTLHPKQETDIDVQYRDQKGNHCGGKIDTYMDGVSRGTVSIQILGCHELKFESNVNGSLI
jgi:hypothetical protein